MDPATNDISASATWIARKKLLKEEERRRKKEDTERKQVRFTIEATIIQVSATRGWYYKKCIACNMKVTVESPDPQYADHGPQPTANYG
ncbi:hypothetical protein Tco_0450148 [Tanacetum coccineum]